MMRLEQQISTLRTLSDIYRANIAQVSDWSGPLKLTADPPLGCMRWRPTDLSAGR